MICEHIGRRISNIHSGNTMNSGESVKIDLKPAGCPGVIWTPKTSMRGISQNLNFKHMIDFSHLNIIPVTLYDGIMPYLNK